MWIDSGTQRTPFRFLNKWRVRDALLQAVNSVLFGLGGSGGWKHDTARERTETHGNIDRRWNRLRSPRLHRGLRPIGMGGCCTHRRHRYHWKWWKRGERWVCSVLCTTAGTETRWDNAWFCMCRTVFQRSAEYAGAAQLGRLPRNGPSPPQKLESIFRRFCQL